MKSKKNITSSRLVPTLFVSRGVGSDLNVWFPAVAAGGAVRRVYPRTLISASVHLQLHPAALLTREEPMRNPGGTHEGPRRNPGSG